jgi:hypothetical protein
VIVNSGVSLYVPCYKCNVHMLGYAKYPLRIKKMFRYQAKCWRLYRQFCTAEIYAKYKLTSKACHCAVPHHLHHVETELVANGILGSFYKYTNRKLDDSDGITTLRDGDSKIITFSTDKAVLLNNYFSSMFTVDNGIFDVNRLPKQVQSAMPCVCFTLDLVLKYTNGKKLFSLKPVLRTRRSYKRV